MVLRASRSQLAFRRARKERNRKEKKEKMRTTLLGARQKGAMQCESLAMTNAHLVSKFDTVLPIRDMYFCASNEQQQQEETFLARTSSPTRLPPTSKFTGGHATTVACRPRRSRSPGRGRRPSSSLNRHFPHERRWQIDRNTSDDVQMSSTPGNAERGLPISRLSCTMDLRTRMANYMSVMH
jgi:hypothetical protein